jgi:phosphate transport system substrate-binding protein
MSQKSPLIRFVPIATLGLAIAGFTAQQVQAQSAPPSITGTTVGGVVVAPGNQYIDCGQAGDQAGLVCSNGAGATFPFPLFAGGVPDSTPAGAFRTLFPDLFNYASIGSGGGITSFLNQLPPSSILVNGVPLSTITVPGPLSFASTDAPLTQAQLDTFYAAGANLNNLGYGVPVEIPLTSGAVTVSFNDGTTPAVAGTPIQLTRANECTLFNGGSVTLNGVTYSQGVRRSDNSGTTFIMSNHLNTVCTPLGLWTKPTGGSRGFGQVSVPDTNAACTTAANAPSNTVCWPASFLSGSGNPGVAAAVNSGGAGTFGYVEFATAASNVDGSVDTGLTATAPRAFPNLDISAVENPNGGSQFVAPTANEVTLALSEQADQSTAACRLVINAPDPTTPGSYPIVGVNYGLFYSDYAPDITRGGANSPRVGAFGGQGVVLRDRYRQLVQRLNLTTSGRALQTQFGYAPLPNTAPAGVTPLANRTVATAVTCINNVVGANGIAGQDVAPQIAP